MKTFFVVFVLNTLLVTSAFADHAAKVCFPWEQMGHCPYRRAAQINQEIYDTGTHLLSTRQQLLDGMGALVSDPQSESKRSQLTRLLKDYSETWNKLTGTFEAHVNYEAYLYDDRTRAEHSAYNAAVVYFYMVMADIGTHGELCNPDSGGDFSDAVKAMEKSRKRYRELMVKESRDNPLSSASLFTSKSQSMTICSFDLQYVSAVDVVVEKEGRPTYGAEFVREEARTLGLYDAVRQVKKVVVPAP